MKPYDLAADPLGYAVCRSALADIFWAREESVWREKARAYASSPSDRVLRLRKAVLLKRMGHIQESLSHRRSWHLEESLVRLDHILELMGR